MTLPDDMATAREGVAAALGEAAIAPERWHDRDCGCDDPACRYRPPPGPWLVTEWVALVAFVNADTGDIYILRLPSEGLPRYRRDGLLHHGLYGMD